MSIKVNPKSISLQEDLTEADYNHYRQMGMVAVDCEMSGLNPYRDLLCLVQLCDSSGYIRLVRTADWAKASYLKDLFASSEIQKVFHFAIMDCGFILQYLHTDVKNAFCTKIASKLARTYTEEHSLASLVKELMGVEMNKSEQSTFWMAETLTEKQLSYAAHDVVYLIDARQRLMEMLEKKGSLPTGISYLDLNKRCQDFIPTLVHLWINGWDFGRQEKSAALVFGR
jgi:ribonuclease D